jgi:hypothetical protein
MGTLKLEELARSVKFCFRFLREWKSGQQTPRRWGWGTPLKKRTATRIIAM